MGVPGDVLSRDKGLTDWNIIHSYRGSIAHGMYVPKSDPNSIDDKDTMAFCVPPREFFIGLEAYGSKGTREIVKDEWDIVIYEVRKAMQLLSQGNPNILSMLWCGENMYIHRSGAGIYLIENRDLFVGRHTYRSFVGYAYGQLHRMDNPNRFGHMGEKRKELLNKFGYDTKNAAHLIRLLRMGAEFLKDGVLYVQRMDAQQLLEIKRGLWTREQVTAEADRWFKIAEEAYINSSLPQQPDKSKVNKLCIEVVEMAWAER